MNVYNLHITIIIINSIIIIIIIVILLTCILGTGGQNSKGAQLGRDPTQVPAWQVRRLEVALLPSM